MCRIAAEQIKASVIDWLINNYSGVIIGNEIMYGTSRKMVDLLAIFDNRTIAFEIKSSVDTLTRLPEQINEYKKVFDEINVVSATSHLTGIKRIISPSIGLFSIEQELKELQKAKENSKTVKLEMLYSISSSYLKKVFPNYRNLNSDLLRQKISRENKNTIHNILIDFYKKRLSEKYRLFLSDRGEQTLIDDIPTLSSFTTIDQL